jgi:hypothetical protein
MAPGRCCHGAFGTDRCSGKIYGLLTTRRRQEPKRIARQETEATALLAGRQLADVASSGVLVMRGCPSQLQYAVALELSSWIRQERAHVMSIIKLVIGQASAPPRDASYEQGLDEQILSLL